MFSILGETGKNLDVVMGGGRGYFIPKDIVDEEGQLGGRSDGQNLIKQWLDHQKASNKNAAYIWKKDQLAEVLGKDKVLGLFESSHTKFNMYRNKDDPSLTDMMEAAIKILDNKGLGYFLFVEGRYLIV